ncbi:MAG: ABC transporter permease [Phycisphaerae bacterium]|nr:ABC transporter permease [Phycisphaerae bacterium]
MSQAQATTQPIDVERRTGRSFWADARRRILRDKAAMICLAVIALYVLIALGGVAYDVVAGGSDAVPAFADTNDYDNANRDPSLEAPKYWLGTDWAGKSILFKVLLGAKTSLTVGFMANIIAVPLGMILGALAGYYGKWIDSVIVWVFSTLASIPGIILLISMRYAFKGITILGLDLTGIHGLYIVLGVISWIGTCRLVRAETMKIRELDYVLAGQAIGTPGFIILLRHVIPNVLHLGIINFSLGFVGAIKAEVILSYLGLGVAVGTPSWGSMINSARMDLVVGRWWELTAAVGAMFLLVLAMNIFGDRLRDALDPKLRNV